MLRSSNAAWLSAAVIWILVAASAAADSPADPGVLPTPGDLAAARRLAREGRHAEAIAVLDEVLSRRPGDTHALAARGFSRLFVEPVDEAAARADLERALVGARDDRRLAAQVEFNLGLLDAHLLRGLAATQHFARSNELRPTRAAAERASARCVVDVRIDEGRGQVVERTWSAVAGAFLEGFEPDRRPFTVPGDERRARESLCGGRSDCALDAPLPLGFDDGGTAYGGAVVPISGGRARVVAPMVEGMSNYRCSAELGGDVVASTGFLHVTASAVATGVGEDGECWYDRVEDAHALVDPRSGRAILIRVVQRGLDTLDRPRSPVEVDASPAGARVRGCGIDRVVSAF